MRYLLSRLTANRKHAVSACVSARFSRKNHVDRRFSEKIGEYSQPEKRQHYLFIIDCGRPSPEAIWFRPDEKAPARPWVKIERVPGNPREDRQ